MDTYTNILKENSDKQNFLGNAPIYSIRVLSNITVNQLKDFLEVLLRRNKINAHITFGDYNNIVQNSLNSNDYHAVIIFWEIINVIEGLHYRIDLMNKKEIDQLKKNLKEELKLVFKNLKTIPIVLFNTFSSYFVCQHYFPSELEKVSAELNQFLSNNKPDNFTIIKLENIFSDIPYSEIFNHRFFYSSKALYNIKFYEQYSNFVAPIFLSILGKTKKAIIFDCDNTLWKGIIGEDGIKNLKMSKNDKDGAIFEEIQYLAKYASRKGIIVGLCSKNNHEDIDEVLKNHSDMVLKNDDILIKKVNWKDKTTNLVEIASELNIGIDSLVFIDDSEFEINLVKQQLPEVKTIMVPRKLYNYPIVFRKCLKLFYNHSVSEEDKYRSKMYKAENERSRFKQQFQNIDNYLKNLALLVEVNINDITQIARIAQLTQKTNQFNLTTRRYTEKQILFFMEDINSRVFSFSVNDKFGNYGTTAVIILSKQNSVFTVDTFLMSCRIIGRNIELNIFDWLVAYVKQLKEDEIYMSYIPTKKNLQVSNFWDQIGAQKIYKKGEETIYILKLKYFSTKGKGYITLRENYHEKYNK